MIKQNRRRPMQPAADSDQRSAVWWKACAALAAAVLAYGVMNHLLLSDVIEQLPARPPYKSAAYLVWLAAGFATFAAFVFTAPRAALAVALPIFFVSLAMNYGYVVIAKTRLSLDVIEWLPHEAGQLSNAWAEYGRDIAVAMVEAAVVLALFLLIRRALLADPRLSKYLTRTATRVAAAFAFLAFQGASVALQPPLSVAETNLFVFGVPSLFSTVPDPAPVPVKPAAAPAARHVVLVVDESVTHDAYVKVIAPPLREFPAVDFGEAASTANCSASSNALLRWGVEKARIGDPAYDPRVSPTIWGYARAAGFRTVLIDGQSRGSMHNYLNRKEFALIDEFVPAYTDENTDHRIALMLNDRLRSASPQFIYVVKHGAHFPYEMNYPKGTLPPDAARVDKFFAAVRYASAGFFERLAKDLPFEHILLVYTSDHGQDFRQRAAHCNASPHADEYSSPLAVVSAAPAVRGLLAAADGMRDRASHLNVFSTLVWSFGFPREWVERTYGPTLAGPPAPYVTYVHLGWRAGASRSERHTVRATDFKVSETFPRRAR